MRQVTAAGVVTVGICVTMLYGKVCRRIRAWGGWASSGQQSHRSDQAVCGSPWATFHKAFRGSGALGQGTLLTFVILDAPRPLGALFQGG